MCCSCLLLPKNALETLQGAWWARVNGVTSQKKRLNFILLAPRPLVALLDDLFNNIVASPPSRRGRKAMCGTRQGLPTGLNRRASRAALFFVCFVLEPIEREPTGAALCPRARWYFSPFILPYYRRFLKQLLFWDESQMIYILLIHPHPALTQSYFLFCSKNKIKKICICYSTTLKCTFVFRHISWPEIDVKVPRWLIISKH